MSGERETLVLAISLRHFLRYSLINLMCSWKCARLSFLNSSLD